MPIISVITPIFNSEKYLSRCISSIINQTFTDFELLLIDDGSEDQSGRICNEFAVRDKRIHVIHQSNRGAAAARNLGIDWAMNNSDCQWIAFIDSDDWVHPQYLEFLLNAAVSLSVKVAASYFLKTDEYKVPEIIDIPEYEKVVAEEFWCRDYLTSTIVCAKLYARELFETIRYPEGKIHEDEFVTYRLLFRDNAFAIVKSELYYYFQSENSVMRAPWSVAHLAALDAYLEQIDYFRENGYLKAFRNQSRIFARLCGKTVEQIDKNVTDPKEKALLRKKWLSVLRKFVCENRKQLSFSSSPRALVYSVPGIYYLVSNLKKLVRIPR